jgi:general secretion pathway protein D
MLMGCAQNSAIQDSQRMAAQGRVEESLSTLEQAMRAEPSNQALRAQWFRQRDSALAQWLQEAALARQARNWEAAEAAYLRVQGLDANNVRAREGLASLEQDRKLDGQLRAAQALVERNDWAGAERILRPLVSEAPHLSEPRRLLQKVRDKLSSEAAAPPSALKSSYDKPITLEFRDTPLKTVFEVMARTSGINFVFDKDVKADNKVTIYVRNTSVEDVVKLILVTNQLERKLLNDNTLLIYPNTPAKAKEYVDLVTRSFYLANADAKQALSLVRTMVKTKDIFIDDKLNLLVMKDTPDAVRLAEHLLESLDMAEPEVMLDVEVLEITRSKLVELGLRFPDQVGYGMLQPSTSSTIVNNGVTETNTNLGGTLAPGYVDLRNTGALTSFVSNPAVLLNLRNQIGDGNTLANPRIRVKNREKAKVHIGDKLPIFTTTSTANVGVAASVAYLDVGLKLDVEPNVYLEDEVSIKVGLEVSSIVKEVLGPANSLAYQVGTRSASTVLRLRNGETQVLAGLISEEERSSANRLPGLGEVPILGRLFSSKRDSSNKTEIVLLITPRIVRNLERPESATKAWAAGSEAVVGSPALQLKRSAPGSVAVSGGAARTAAPAAVPAPVVPEIRTDDNATPEGAAAVPASGSAALPPAAVESSPSAP